MENPLIDFETNAKGTLCVLEKARKDDAKLVFASSAAVYGNPTQLPTSEEYGFHPFSCYGLSKVVGEEYCQMYREQYGLDIVITRFANVYGCDATASSMTFSTNSLKTQTNSKSSAQDSNHAISFMFLMSWICWLRLARLKLPTAKPTTWALAKQQKSLT